MITPRSLNIPSSTLGRWLEVGPWEEAPWWHPMNWLCGWTHRQMTYACGGLGDEPEWWNYGMATDVANDMLKEQFGGR